MGFIAKIGCLILLESGAVLPVVLAAQSKQSSSSAPSPTLNEQQRLGRVLFMQNCSLCHLPYKTEDKTGRERTTIGPVLNGLFRGQKPMSEQDLRTFILRGVPKKMPGFQYGLESKEIETIIAYLRTL